MLQWFIKCVKIRKKGGESVDNNRLFVVFSATPLKMGRFIRTATGERYNHVSLSLSPRLEKMYSFARRYKSTPLYGGFVCETPARYRYKGRVAEAFICALPLSDEKHDELRELFADMERNRFAYNYNLFSAALAPLSRRLPIKNCFTCAEFASYVISRVEPKISAEKFYSVDDLRRILGEYAFYFGPFPHIGEGDGDCNYEKKIPFHKKIRLTVGSGMELVRAGFSRKRK